MAGKLGVLDRRAGGPLVRVGAGDDAVLEWIDAETPLLGEAHLQRIAHEIGFLRRRREQTVEAVGDQVVVGKLLEAAELVVLAGTAQPKALRVALVLEDLDQRLVGLTGLRVLEREWIAARILRAEHLSR